MLRVWWLAIAVFLTLVMAPRAVDAAEPRMPDLSTPEKAFETWRAEVFGQWLSRLNQGIVDRPGFCGELPLCIERAGLTLQKDRQRKELATEKERVLPVWERLTIADVKLNDVRAEVSVTEFRPGIKS